VKNVAAHSAPDDHFTVDPHCRVLRSSSGCVGGAGGRPTIRARVVSPTGVQAKSTPDDHFTASPHCRVIVSARGCVGGAGGSPTVRAGVISRACSKPISAVRPTPDDHFTAGTAVCQKQAAGALVVLVVSNCPCWGCISR